MDDHIMKAYDLFQLEDFVQDIYFRQWVLGQLEPEDEFWTNWQKKYPEKKGLLEQAALVIKTFQCDPGYVNPQADAESINSIMAAINLPAERKLWVRNWLSVAAVTLLAVGLSFLLLTDGKDRQPTYLVDSWKTDAGVKNYENTAQDPMYVLLSDGSEIWLQKASSLRVDESFGQSVRKVILEGAAEFKVQRDVKRPFYVYANGLTTKVLGTTFKVVSYDQDKVSVSVSSGKVTVYQDKPNKEIELSDELILKPNQQAIFFKTEKKLVKTLVEKPLRMPEELNISSIYNESPMNQVLKDLEMAYGVTILYDEDLLKKCNLTATLSSESLYDKLELICETIHAKYQIVDGQILITARGCI
ncbi:uncharacterized protein DUF4974 [Dyadobacter jejuensis]|uniref:Uncharacterized protein DUF4974 n=1 Tax=Dyadobacter jejuensis TaxID=1082580 RepID=A0A316A8L7_9BACT|nr:FecR family protein [Dyadobacter jejuensis]PWJ54266.1 uncharacterized protein DUF4974 [Dyadobacter jejuensis]